MLATGKKIKVSGMDILRVAGGKLLEHWDIDDTLGMMQQLGVIPTTFQAQA
jgi:predicted ester cyclase